MKRFVLIFLGLLASPPVFQDRTASGDTTAAFARGESQARRARPRRPGRVLPASWGFGGRSACTPRAVDRTCMPLCRRGPVVVPPQPCGAMMMVVAPAVLAPVPPTSAPEEAAASAAASPVITRTAASTDYEWNPTFAGAPLPARVASGPLLGQPSQVNADLPLLTPPGFLVGLSIGLGGSSRGARGATTLFDDDPGSDRFVALPALSSSGIPRGSAVSRSSATEEAIAQTTRDGKPAVDPAMSIAAVPEPGSLLTTITGLGLLAASAIRRLRPSRTSGLPLALVADAGRPVMPITA